MSSGPSKGTTYGGSLKKTSFPKALFSKTSWLFKSKSKDGAADPNNEDAHKGDAGDKTADKVPKCVFGAPLPLDFKSRNMESWNALHFVHGVPVVVHKTIEHLTEHGLDTEGLFRVSASLNQVTHLRGRFDRGEEVNLLDPKAFTSVHVSASLLKLYFRELPNSVVPFSLSCALEPVLIDKHQHFSYEHKLVTLKNKIQKYLVYEAPVYYATLKVLVRFLHLVSEHSDANKMSSVNLAICFAPNLMKYEYEEGTSKTSETCDDGTRGRKKTSIFESPHFILIVKLMIDEYYFIFEDGEILLHKEPKTSGPCSDVFSRDGDRNDDMDSSFKKADAEANVASAHTHQTSQPLSGKDHRTGIQSKRNAMFHIDGSD